MKGGDISNEVSPRLWFVFEGLIVLPLDDLAVIIQRWHRRRRPKLYDFFIINPIAEKRLWDLTLGRYDFHCEIVTFVPGWEEEAARWVGAVDLPASVHYMHEQEFLDRTLSPSVARVYDPDPLRVLRWGSKGMYVDPHQDFEPLL